MNSARISELLKARPKTNLYLGVYLASPGNGAQPDLGLAIAKKLARRAVDRNKIKRMIRQLVWAAQSSHLNSDLVVKLKKPIGRESKGKLRKRELTLLRSQMMELL